METFDAPLNTDKFIYYCEATQKKWSILSYIKTTSQFNAFCSALSRCSIVEEIDLSELPKLEEDNIKNLIAALESNSSLTSLKLFRGLPYDGDLMPLFDTLARKKQLRSLSISCREGSDNFVAVLHYCRNATEITNLSISNVTEQTGVQILDALEGHKNLNELSIGDADEWSHAGLGKLGNFLNRHKNIKKYYFFATSESIDFLSKFLDSTEVIDFAYAKSSDNIMEEGDEEEDVPTAKPVQIVSKEDPPFEHESNLTKLFLDLLPMEINRKILYSININNLMAVLRTCKRTMEICRSNNFWRDYYLTHFDCIPEEVFETVGVRYGDQLIGTNSIEDLKPTNFWYLALKAMKFIYNVPKTAMPQTIHPILQMVTKMFPQLKYSYMMKIENDMVWFTADGSVDSDTYSAHRLGVQYQKEFNKYNAILLRKFNYIDHLYTNNPFDHILYILGWIQEENVEEFLEKLKPLAEMFTLLNYNNKYTSHAEIIPKRGLSDHFSNLDLTITATAKKIEEHVTKLLSDIEYNTQIDLQHLEQIITKFKNSTPVQVDYGLYKQKLPLRSDLNAKKIYSYENRLYNFHNGEWDLDEHINKYWSKVSTTDLKTKHHRSAKKNATTEVMKLTRVIMNYIMMPLLRVFWPQNSKDVDYLKSNCSAHYALTTQYEQFYMTPYVPINSVSIAKGYPKHWPAIAIGVSHLIVDQIFNVVDDIALNNNTEGSIAQLILALEKIGFYSKNALDEIRTFLLTVTNKTS